MKNFKYLIIVALMVAFGCGQAAADFRFGIKAGLNVNKINTENWQSTFSAGNRCGFTGGVMAEFTVPIIGIGADLSLMYTHMSGELEDNANSTGSVSKNYIEIPLNLKYKLTLPIISKYIKPMIYTGPNFAFKLDNGIFNNFKTKTTQLGWNLGVGLELVKHLQICGGYTFGINNVAKYVGAVNNNLNLTDVKIKNNYWTITAAYLF